MARTSFGRIGKRAMPLVRGAGPGGHLFYTVRRRFPSHRAGMAGEKSATVTRPALFHTRRCRRAALIAQNLFAYRSGAEGLDPSALSLSEAARRIARRGSPHDGIDDPCPDMQGGAARAVRKARITRHGSAARDVLQRELRRHSAHSSMSVRR